MTQKLNIDNGLQAQRTERQHLTAVWQKWRFSAPQTHLWLIKVRFSASTFVVKIATFAKPQTVIYPYSLLNFFKVSFVKSDRTSLPLMSARSAKSISQFSVPDQNTFLASRMASGL